MKLNVFPLTFGGLALLGAWGAQAQTVLLPSPVAVTTDAPLRLSQADLREFAGEFALSNGSSLRVVQRGAQLFAVVDGGAPLRLVATAPNTFVSASGATRLAFAQQANGNVPGILEFRGPSDAPRTYAAVKSANMQHFAAYAEQ